MDYFLSSNKIGVFIEGKPLYDNSYIKINLNNNIIPIYDQFKQNKTGFLQSKYSVNFVIGMNQIEFRYFNQHYKSEKGNVLVDKITVKQPESEIELNDCIIFQSTNTLTVDGNPLQEIYQGYQRDIKFNFNDIESIQQIEKTTDHQSLKQQSEQMPSRLFYGTNLKQTDGDTISLYFDLNKTTHPVIVNDVFKSNPNYIYTFKLYSYFQDLSQATETFDPKTDKYIGVLNTNDPEDRYNIKKYNIFSIKDFVQKKSIRVLYQDTMETSPFGDKGYNGTYGNLAKELTGEFIKNNIVFFNFTNEPLKDKYGRFLQDQYYGEQVKEHILSYNLIWNGLQTPSYSSSNEQYSQRYNDYIHEQMLEQDYNRRGIWKNLDTYEKDSVTELNSNIDLMHDQSEGNDVGRILWVQGTNPANDYHEDYFYYQAYSMNINGIYTINDVQYTNNKFYIFIPKYVKEKRNYEYNIIRDKILSKKDEQLKVYGEIRFSIENNFYYTIVYNTQQIR